MVIDIGNGNGIGSPDRLAKMIAELEEMASDLAIEVAEAQLNLDQAKARHAQVQKATALLKGESLNPSAAKRRRTISANQHGWTPSEERIASVLAVLQSTDEQLSVTDVANRSGHSREVAAKALEILREREQVRFMGKAGRGGAKMFAVMPNG